MLVPLLLAASVARAAPADGISRQQLSAMTTLSVGQALAGGYLLGPHLARLSYDPQRSATPYYLGALGGVAVGAGSGIWLGSREGFDQPKATTILAAEVLGGATGATIGLLADPHDQLGPGWGLLGGAAGGAALGVGLAHLDPSPTVALATGSGAAWGLGLAGAGLVITEGAETPEGAVLPLVLCADLGAAAGWILAERLDLSHRQVAFFDLGGALGAAGGLLVVGLIGSNDDLSEDTAAVLVSSTAVGGAFIAAALAGPDRRAAQGAPLLAHAAVWGAPGDLHLSLPVPSSTPSPGGPQLDLRLVDYRF